MIDEKLVENIRRYGTFRDDGSGRRRVLDDIGYPTGESADYAIIMGCFQPEAMPHVLKDLKALLDHLQVSYTLLSKEYCCGWMAFGQPAVMARNEEDIASYRELSREFVLENFKQAKELGAKSVALFCGACEPSYTNCADATDLEVISYSELLGRHWKSGRLDEAIDYYAGCYRFRRRVTSHPVDIEHAARLLGRVDGLKVNHLDSTRCCYIPPHMEELAGSVTSDTVVTICTGCYQNVRRNLAEKGNCQVKMLPEVLLEAVRNR